MGRVVMLVDFAVVEKKDPVRQWTESNDYSL